MFHQCEYCVYKTPLKSNLRRHIKNKHVNEAKGVEGGTVFVGNNQSNGPAPTTVFVGNNQSNLALLKTGSTRL